MQQAASSLFDSVQQGNLDAVKKLVDNVKKRKWSNGLLDLVDGNGMSVLHWGALQGHSVIIRWLLSPGGGRAAGFTNVLALDKSGMTAMHLAAMRGHLECCKALVECCMGKNGERSKMLNAVNDEGWTVLHLVSREGHTAIVRWLLSSDKGGGRAAGFTNVLAKKNNGETALHLAAREGYLECCQALVEGCNIENGERAELLNAVDAHGGTVLHLAAQVGHLSIIQWLLSSSEGGGRAAGFAKVLAKAMDGRTALHVAGGRGYLECCQALVEGCNIENGERAELLNEVDAHGGTVLHLAAQVGHLSIVRWLLSSSDGGGRAAGFAKVLAKAIDGLTAMHAAAWRGHLECCQALVEGCNIENGERAELINAVDDAGWTVLHWAAQKSHASTIKWLLSSSEGGGRAAGFNNVLANTYEQKTALHVAALDGHLECCQALVEGCMIENGERAALINAVDEEGLTVLHWASLLGHLAIIRWLLSNEGGRAAGFTSSSITANTSDASSALHLVSQNGAEGLKTLLAGCTVGERLTLFLSVEEHGWTALHTAARNRYSDIIRGLLLHHPETQTIVDARDHRGMTALHRAVIGGIDEESRKEWQGDGESDNIGDAAVIEALLIAPKKDDDDDSQAAKIDPNLGLKIE